VHKFQATNLPDKQHFVWWCLTFVSPQFGNGFISPFWHPWSWCGSYIFGNLNPCSKLLTICQKKLSSRWWNSIIQLIHDSRDYIVGLPWDVSNQNLWTGQWGWCPSKYLHGVKNQKNRIWRIGYLL
jgi:hypothetical protein